MAQIRTARPDDVIRDERGRAVSWRGHPVVWAPHPGPQTEVLSSNCFEIMYGGAAGGGKTASGCAGALLQVGKGYGRNYRALLLRRHMTDMEATLLPECEALYPALGGPLQAAKEVLGLSGW